MMENLKLLFFGDESKMKKDQLEKVNVIVEGQKKQIFNLWRGNAKGMKKFDRIKAGLITKLTDIRQQTQNKNVRDYAIRKFA